MLLNRNFTVFQEWDLMDFPAIRNENEFEGRVVKLNRVNRLELGAYLNFET